MTPLQFEQEHAVQWAELETLLDAADGKRAAVKDGAAPRQRRWRSRPQWDGARLSALYRRACEHLALAQARSYPVYIIQRLEAATQRAHQLIYRRREYGLGQLRQLVLVSFPEAVRAHRWYVLVAALLFYGPLLLVGLATYLDPGFILHVADAEQVQQYDAMYSDGAEAWGKAREADTDWQMFGYYVMHNIGIGFQTFAAGIFLGLGSVFFLAFNGVSIGAVGGYLIASGHAENFLSFVVTHSAFELTAIVLAGAAGLRLGFSLLAPGRRTRLEALKLAASDAILVVYGVIGLLLIAAALEAFWSSARWVVPAVKYGVGAACWVLVLAYLGWQGRPGDSDAG